MHSQHLMKNLPLKAVTGGPPCAPRGLPIFLELLELLLFGLLPRALGLLIACLAPVPAEAGFRRVIRRGQGYHRRLDVSPRSVTSCIV